MKSIVISSISLFEQKIVNGEMIILLKIPNIDNYDIENKDDKLILTKKIEFLKDDEMIKCNLGKSKILECKVSRNLNNECISTNTKYIKILIDIYKSMISSEIIQNTTMNIDIGDKLNGVKGYKFFQELGISIQGKDAIGTFKEICNIIRHNNYKLYIIIRLDNGHKIGYRI